MSDRARGNVTPTLIILLAFALLVVCAAVWDIASQTTYDALNAEHQAAQHAKIADQDIQSSCAGLDLAATTECVAKIVEASQEAQRADRDLNAQQNMARWAFWLLIVSALGIVLLFVTFLETQKAAEAAYEVVDVTREIGVAQVRAYVTPIHNHVKEHRYGQYFLVQISIKNSGDSPAVEVRCGFGALFANVKDEAGIRLSDVLPDDQSYSYIAPDDTVFVDVKSRAPITPGQLQSMWRKTHAFFVLGRIDYIDMFERDRHTTYKVFIQIAEDESAETFVCRDGNEAK